GKYSKTFHSAIITVDFQTQTIIYPDEITIHDKTTSNFSHPENFVVLECVNKLLSLGYKAKHIELEPKWRLGRDSKTSGKADIIVKGEDEKYYLIIECKTFGNEFNKEKAKMHQYGGQLFSYFQQDKNAKFVCLYASDFDGEQIKREYFAVDMRDDERLKTDLLYKNAHSVEEVFKVWDKTYEKDSFNSGIFEDNLTPYKIQEISPNINHLQEISHDDIQKKYHEFATILRQHNISGRENAFDKLLNLFLCKVIDEKQNPQKLAFNYRGKRYDDIYDFCDRLQKLYQKGMRDFLNTEITYVSNEQINKAFRFVKNDPDATKEKINDLFTQLKYYTNNDFAFIEVYNKELFEKNTQILIKMVKMLENIRLTGATHNQFLGDLFEGFLDSGIKQSEGQFFTPLPLVKFIISSLPIKEIINSQDEVFTIDYACGAGHFLNEYANYIRNFTTHNEIKQKELESCIYGIEKETRLAKVSKVASFMYNQNIHILGKDALSEIDEIKQQKFDILIANPPYSVKGFLSTLNKSERQKYELSHIVGENLSTNNAIECFFIEKAAQILNENGVAGIIVPSSLINKNGEIFKKTREILLRNFKIIAISEFGNKTFGQTGTNTVVLFLQKYSQKPSYYESLKDRSEHIFKGDLNAVYQDENDLEKYCEFMDYPLVEYKNFLSGSLKEDSTLFNNETFNEYRQKIKKSTVYKNLAKKKTSTQTDLQRLICNEILSIEKTKFIYFMLICNQQTLITKSPTDNKEQSKFLGYEWSNRKGSEGIKYLNFPNSNDEDEDEITETSKALQSINTALYDPNENPNDEQTLNPNKLNFWIRQNFIQAIQKDTANLSGSLKNSEASKYAQMVYLRDCIDFKKAEFDLAINLSAQSKIEIESKYPLVKLDSVLLFIRNGKNVNQIDEVGKYKVARIETIANAIVDTNAVKYTNDEVSNEHFFDYGDIILSHINSLKHLGKTAIFDIHEKLIHGINILRLKPNQEKILPIYLFRLTKTEYFKNEILTYCSKAVNQSSINITNLKNIQIPLPP
ncbi:MAG: N-6 DNA methylase, partial [Neisseriaceae bacterium]|nr:N-6 DNA methylase [Neisseriaceae bacterium]